MKARVMSYFSRTITPILTSTVPELLIYSMCGASNLQAEFGSEPIAGKENEEGKKKKRQLTKWNLAAGSSQQQGAESESVTARAIKFWDPQLSKEAQGIL